MNITLTGVSGFIGGRLIPELREQGHELHVLGRRPVPGVKFSSWDSLHAEPPSESLAAADAIIHLAGEPVAQRWTPEAKQRIRDSRIAGTRHLVHALSTQSHRPEVLISASAIGFYGATRGDEILTERSKPGEGFLADLAKSWEQEAEMAESLGIRVVRLRIGVVLGKGGGALEKILPPFKAFAGGRLGSGKQWMSWIHVEDIVKLILFTLNNRKLTGPVNATAPNAVTNGEFTDVLAEVIHRPAVFTVPGFALKTMLGEMSEVVLGSLRVRPECALEAGYKFAFVDAPTALFDILGR